MPKGGAFLLRAFTQRQLALAHYIISPPIRVPGHVLRPLESTWNQLLGIDPGHVRSQPPFFENLDRLTARQRHWGHWVRGRHVPWWDGGASKSSSEGSIQATVGNPYLPIASVACWRDCSRTGNLAIDDLCLASSLSFLLRLPGRPRAVVTMEEACAVRTPSSRLVPPSLCSAASRKGSLSLRHRTMVYPDVRHLGSIQSFYPLPPHTNAQRAAHSIPIPFTPQTPTNSQTHSRTTMPKNGRARRYRNKNRSPKAATAGLSLPGFAAFASPASPAPAALPPTAAQAQPAAPAAKATQAPATISTTEPTNKANLVTTSAAATSVPTKEPAHVSASVRARARGLGIAVKGPIRPPQ